MHRRVRLLAGEHQARHLGRLAVGPRQKLVEARARADLAARGQRGAGKQVARLRAVDVALLRLGVEQPADEEHPLAEVGQRGEHLAELHVAAAPRAHHSWLWKPLPENRTARRTGASLAPRTALASSPQTRSDSIHGSAMLTPTPRRKVRREKL